MCVDLYLQRQNDDGADMAWRWNVCWSYLQWRNGDGAGMVWRWSLYWSIFVVTERWQNQYSLTLRCMLICICSDGTMTEYDLLTMTCLRVLRGHKGPVRAIQVGSCLCVNWLLGCWMIDWMTIGLSRVITDLLTGFLFVFCDIHSVTRSFTHLFTRSVYSFIQSYYFSISYLIV